MPAPGPARSTATISLATAFVSLNQRLLNEQSDFCGALRKRMHEVRADEPRLCVVPKPHGSRPAHRFESIEEGAAGFRRDCLLHLNELLESRRRNDFAAFHDTPVHRTHDEKGSMGERLMNSLYRGTQFIRV